MGGYLEDTGVEGRWIGGCRIEGCISRHACVIQGWRVAGWLDVCMKQGWRVVDGQVQGRWVHREIHAHMSQRSKTGGWVGRAEVEDARRIRVRVQDTE